MRLKEKSTVANNTCLLIVIHFQIKFIFVFLILFQNSFAQHADILSLDDQKKIINTICEKLDEIHAFPEYNLDICNGLLMNFENGKYSEYKSPQTLAGQLNRDLEILRDDKHLGIFYDAQMAAEMEKENDD